MPSLKVTGDFKSVLKWANVINPVVAKPALNFTLNRIGVKIKNQSASEVARVQSIKVGLIKARIREIRSQFRTLTYRVRADARGITWGSLDPKVIKRGNKGRTAGVRAGKHKHRHAFIARGKNGKTMVFVRENPNGGRYPLRALRVRLNVTFEKAFDRQITINRRDLAPTFYREFNRRLAIENAKVKK